MLENIDHSYSYSGRQSAIEYHILCTVVVVKRMILYKRFQFKLNFQKAMQSESEWI